VDEFDLIKRYFDRAVKAPGVVTGIGDDGAVLAPVAENSQLVQVVDTLVSGVHFPADTAPADIAYRVVAVNLSDIAAMAATPRWMTLALTLPDSDPDWLQQFANGLFAAADAFDVALVGGDTTRGPDVVASVAITGEVETGQALLRSGARPGDSIFVSGTVGDAAGGLALMKQGRFDDELGRRFLRPTPRIGVGRSLQKKASAAIDISDGLAGDLRKLLDASGVAGQLDIESLPLSAALLAHFDVTESRNLALTGGDDYELCFTADAAAVREIEGVTAIGRVTQGSGLICHLDGDVVHVDDCGYRHFS
jgi:thiamine-monophosphate kinase